VPDGLPVLGRCPKAKTNEGPWIAGIWEGLGFLYIISWQGLEAQNLDE